MKQFDVGYNENDKDQSVVIYMANSIEAVIAMLACARRGVPHSVVFGGFAAKVCGKKKQSKILFNFPFYRN